MSFCFASYFSSPERAIFRAPMKQLTDSRNTAIALMTASTATSAAITLLPDDICSPIAEKLTDLSTGFLIVLAAVLVEKYLLTTIVYVSLKFALPLVCALYIIGSWNDEKKNGSKAIGYAFKIFVFFLILCFCVPASVGVSSLVQKTYKTSIEATLNDAKNITEEVGNTDANAEEAEEEDGFLSGLASKVSDAASALTSGATSVAEKAKSALSNFIEAVAVLIVTDCILPMIVIIIMLTVIRKFWGMDVMSSVHGIKLPRAHKR